jgi:hypothetical protein
VVTAGAEQATGRCTGCGTFPVRGRLVNEVETNSAPFWANVRCSNCTPMSVRLSAAPAGFHARRGWAG